MMNPVIFVLAALLGTSTSLDAQLLPKDYPSKPIKVVVPSPPSGPPDLIIRMLTPKLNAGPAQPVIVENRAGAGGIVGTAFVAKAAARNAARRHGRRARRGQAGAARQRVNIVDQFNRVSYT